MTTKERTLALQRSNSDLMQFAHVISHDLKEPVRKIKIFANRIDEEMKDPLPAACQPYLRKIQHAAGRMSSMIEGVLTYSSLPSAGAPFEPVDLNSVINGIRGDLEILIQQKSARFFYPPLPIVQGIDILVYQLFYNLINNSLKFSRKDIPPIINISVSQPPHQGKGFTQISIKDNGIGFDKTYTDRIFDTFTRLNSKDEFEGTGLGLSLSKKIVERHGGTISAIGNPGEGATFILTLPV